VGQASDWVMIGDYVKILRGKINKNDDKAQITAQYDSTCFLFFYLQETGKARKRGVLGSEMLLVLFDKRRRLSLLQQFFALFFGLRWSRLRH
jgi:hypothetical protein